MYDSNNQGGNSNSIPFYISPNVHPGITKPYEIGNNSQTSFLTTLTCLFLFCLSRPPLLKVIKNDFERIHVGNLLGFFLFSYCIFWFYRNNKINKYEVKKMFEKYIKIGESRIVCGQTSSGIWYCKELPAETTKQLDNLIGDVNGILNKYNKKEGQKSPPQPPLVKM